MKKYFLLAIIFICLLSTLASCHTKLKRKDGRKPVILVSVPPYISIVQAIAENTVEVHSAVSPGFDSHTNEITPSQAKMIQTCDLWIGIGEPYEKKLLSSLREAKQEVRLLQLNEIVKLISYTDTVNFVDSCSDTHLSDHSAYDLHFWTSPLRLIPQAQQIKGALALMIPEHADLYDQNLIKYIDRLKTLDAKIAAQLKPYHKKGVVVSHPFLGYFCHDYHLYQIAIECEGKSPRTQSVNHALALAKNYEVECVFTSPQYNNKGAQLVAEKLNLKIYEVDPLQQDPLDTIQKVVDGITKSK